MPTNSINSSQARSATEITQEMPAATAVQKRYDFIELLSWLNESVPETYRDYAESAVFSCLRGETTLNLANLGITALPGLPDNVTEVIANNNQLQSLPSIGANMQTLDLRNNDIRRLPMIPSTLLILKVRGNPIFDDMSSLDPDTKDLIIRSEAPSSPDSTPRLHRNRFDSVNSDDLYAEPGLFLESDYFSSNTNIASVGVATWYLEEQRADILRKWEKFDSLDGSKEFGQFIEKLKATPLAENKKARTSVLKWLDRLNGSEQFSKAAFQTALESTNSCCDSVLLTFNAMQLGQIELDVKNGDYDKKLPELTEQARIGFRREYIDKFATEKMEQTQAIGSSPDEIEVYLGLQVKLNKRLGLSSIVKEMDSFTLSNLTDDDIDSAEASIKQKENEGFAAWLGTWEPWAAVVKRLAPNDYEAMQEEIIDVYSSDAFNTASGEACTAARRGRPAGLTSGQSIQLDAAIGKETGERLTKNIKLSFMNDFFKQRNMANLLEPKWPVKAPAV